jgi:hypothetical protein
MLLGEPILTTDLLPGDLTVLMNPHELALVISVIKKEVEIHITLIGDRRVYVWSLPTTSDSISRLLSSPHTSCVCTRRRTWAGDTHR